MNKVNSIFAKYLQWISDVVYFYILWSFAFFQLFCFDRWPTFIYVSIRRYSRIYFADVVLERPRIIL